MFDRSSLGEIRQSATELTSALYRVVDTFPKEEPLKNSLKKQALDVLDQAVIFLNLLREEDLQKLSAGTKVLNSYLEVARSAGLTNAINIEVLKRGYRKLENELKLIFIYNEEQETNLEQQFPVADDAKDKEVARESQLKKTIIHKKDQLNERQEKILAHMKERPNARVSDFFSLFESLSPKTIQRDLQDLVRRNILSRGGEKRWTTYTMSDKDL